MRVSRSAIEFHGRQPCRLELKRPKYAPLFLPGTIAMLPEAENRSLNDSGLPNGRPYHAGVVDMKMRPPISPGRWLACFVGDQPKSWTIVGLFSPTTRFCQPSQPGSSEKSCRTCTSPACPRRS